MVKKSLLAIAVVALIAATAQAGDAPNGSYKHDLDLGPWPYVYIEVDLCTLPVYMDVGYYVTIRECNKLSVLLKQVDCTGDRKFPCYSGCVRHKDDGAGFQVRANFDAIFGLKLWKDPDVGILNKTDIYWTGDDPKNWIEGNGEWHKLEFCIDAWETNVYNDGPGDKVKVGEVTVTVKPDSGY